MHMIARERGSAVPAFTFVASRAVRVLGLLRLDRACFARFLTGGAAIFADYACKLVLREVPDQALLVLQEMVNYRRPSHLKANSCEQ